MDIQFLVEPNKRNIGTQHVFYFLNTYIPYKFIRYTLIFLTKYASELQMLPTFFKERWYPQNRWIYLIHNKGTKHKVYWKIVRGNLTLYSHEWKHFLEDSNYRNIAMFHFIREEQDLYYVTAYNIAGYECNGYNLADVGYRQRRCMITLEEIAEGPVIHNL